MARYVYESGNRSGRGHHNVVDTGTGEWMQASTYNEARSLAAWFNAVEPMDEFCYADEWTGCLDVVAHQAWIDWAASCSLGRSRERHEGGVMCSGKHAGPHTLVTYFRR